MLPRLRKTFAAEAGPFAGPVEYQGNVVTLSAQDSALLIENAALRTQEKQAFTSGRWTIRV